MTACSVPNCKIQSKTKFQSPSEQSQLNLWQEILAIDNNHFHVCHEHFEDRFLRTKRLGVTSDAYPSLYLTCIDAGSTDSCQCCMRSFRDENEELFVITCDFRRVFVDVVGCEIQSGLICLKCHDFIADFVKFREKFQKNQNFREKFQKNQKLRENILKTDLKASKMDIETVFSLDYQDQQLTDDVNPRFEVFTIENQKIFKKEPIDIVVDTREAFDAIEIKEEQVQEPQAAIQQVIDVNFVNFIKIEPISQFKVIEKPKSKRGRPKNPNRVIFRSQKSTTVQKSSKNYKCQYCPAKFGSHADILEHIGHRHDFRCQICQTSFPYRITMMQHHVNEHKNVEMTAFHSCPTCKLKFPAKEKLNAHIEKSHVQEQHVTVIQATI